MSGAFCDCDLGSMRKSAQETQSDLMQQDVQPVRLSTAQDARRLCRHRGSEAGGSAEMVENDPAGELCDGQCVDRAAARPSRERVPRGENSPWGERLSAASEGSTLALASSWSELRNPGERLPDLRARIGGKVAFLRRCGGFTASDRPESAGRDNYLKLSPPKAAPRRADPPQCRSGYAWWESGVVAAGDQSHRKRWRAE
jgi:hypothetical protein